MKETRQRRPKEAKTKKKKKELVEKESLEMEEDISEEQGKEIAWRRRNKLDIVNSKNHTRQDLKCEGMRSAADPYYQQKP